MVGELSAEEIKEVLMNNPVGHLGCTDGERVYVVPIHFHYETDAVLCYALEGQKIDWMRKHPSVCLQVDQIRNTFDWKCVIINGLYEEVTDPGELSDLRPLYTEYLLRKKVSVTVMPGEQEPSRKIDTTRPQVFFRIRFQQVSGRYETSYI